LSRYGGCLIRDMRFDDLDRVMSLENIIFSSPWSAELFGYELRDLDRTIYMVAEEGETLRGYFGAQVLDQEVHVTNMAVEPSWRRKGLGSAMLLECIRRALDRGARWLTLEVRVGNDEARRFYRKFEFDELGLRHGYYVDTGEDAIIMATGDIRSMEFAQHIGSIQAALAAKEPGGTAC
jgi:ribosomal-protein-alanine N-acetyltransferase